MFVYFPPRLVHVEWKGGNPRPALCRAFDAYRKLGASVCFSEEALRHAQRVVAYGQSFPDSEEKWRRLASLGPEGQDGGHA